MLVDKEAKEQGYNIDERDAFMAGIDAWIIWNKHNGYKCDICRDTKTVETTRLDGVPTKSICPFCHNKKSEPRTQYCNHFKCGKYFEMDKETFGSLQMIRNYFGKNDRTPFEHMAFEVIDRIIKTNTP